VKTDVGGVKTDLGKTQSDLATTISQLQAVRGDLSGTNSVIARNHDELVMLEHKGDAILRVHFGQRAEKPVAR